MQQEVKITNLGSISYLVKNKKYNLTILSEKGKIDLMEALLSTFILFLKTYSNSVRKYEL